MKKFIAWDGEGIRDYEAEVSLSMVEPSYVKDFRLEVARYVKKQGLKPSSDYPYLSKKYIRKKGLHSGIDEMVDEVNSVFGHVVDSADDLYDILEEFADAKEPKEQEPVYNGVIQKYVFIASSEGDLLEDWDKGLRGEKFVEDIFNLFLKYSKTGIQVIFGGSYDFTMILRSLPYTNLVELRTSEDNSTTWHGYRIQYVRGKYLKVSKNHQTACVYDVLSFFQKSFVKVLKTFFQEVTDEERAEIEEIVKNKMNRREFSIEQRDRIKYYNSLELKWLVKVMTKLVSLASKRGVKLRSYTGAGSYANALMSKYKVLDAYKNGNKLLAPDVVVSIGRQAYFGGRAEIFNSGFISGPVYDYDINSAYPNAIKDLPSLRLGKWYHKKSNITESDIFDFGMYLVRWNYTHVRIGGFPIRLKYTNSLVFPDSGIGWFWGPEVKANLKYVKAHPSYSLDILEGYYFVDSGERPFKWVVDEYMERERFKREELLTGIHNAESDILKLGYNSMYGKFAQRVGAHVKDHAPKFHNILYAGYITSRCRAQILSSLIGHESDIIMIATDGIFTRSILEECESKISTNLGDYEKKTADEMFVIQAGFYFWKEKDKWVSKTRGVLREAMNDKVLADTMRDYLKGIRTFTFPINKFLTVTQVNEQNYKYLGMWVTSTKKNVFGKEVTMLNDDKREWYRVSDRYEDSYAVRNMFPEEFGRVPEFKWGVNDETLSTIYDDEYEDELVMLEYTSLDD